MKNILHLCFDFMSITLAHHDVVTEYFRVVLTYFVCCNGLPYRSSVTDVNVNNEALSCDV